MATDASPSFSIIVPTYERPQQLRGCLDALVRLRYPRYEVIVVDDGSTQPLRSVVASVKDRLSNVALVRQQNAGPAAARNRGARKAAGGYLAFTDDDCRPAPGWLQHFAAQFSQTPKAMVGGRTVNAFPENVYSAASQALASFLSEEDQGSGKRFFPSNNVALPRKQFLEIGGFDSSFPIAAGEDRELCDRWHARGGSMMQAENAVVHHMHGLSPRLFLRQQFNYGRGAYQFHRTRGEESERPSTWTGLPQPLSFYARLVTYPFKQEMPAIRSLALSLLMAAAQGAVATGLLAEVLAQTGSDPSPR